MASSVTLSITYWASRSLRESSSGEENTLSAYSPESTAKESQAQPVNTSLQSRNVLSCALEKRLTLTRAIHLQSSTWANDLFSLMQNMSQTFQPQSGAASRHLTVHAAFHLFFTDAKYVANILAPQGGCFPAPHRPRPVPSFFH